MNCGYGRGYSVREVVDAVKQVSGVDFRVTLAERRPGDPAELVADNGLNGRLFGWQPALDDIELICRSAWSLSSLLVVATRLMDSLSARLWNKDLSLWNATSEDPEVGDRLGWLDVFDWLPGKVGELTSWAAGMLTTDGFSRWLCSQGWIQSWHPLVFAELFGSANGYPSLVVLDSTSPEMVNAVAGKGVEDTLFIVASKSGTTLETMDLYHFFFEAVSRSNDTPGEQFVAITDPVPGWPITPGNRFRPDIPES